MATPAAGTRGRAVTGRDARAVTRPSGRALNDDPRWRWISLSPAVAFFVLLTALPLLNLFVLSFFEVSWVAGSAVYTAVGLQHYYDLPSDNLFRAGILNTTIFVIVASLAQMVIGFFLALLCSRITRGKTLYRAIFTLPILIPGIVIGAIWKLMYNFEFGVINQLVTMVGIPRQDWLGQTSTALLSVIVVDIWHWTPFCFLLLLASLESLPEDVFEAARIDGAGGWQELRWITLPMMWPAILVTLAFRIIVAFKVFDEVYLLTAGGPGTATEVISFTIYQRFFTEDRIGYGSALSVVTIFVVAMLLAVALSSRRKAETGA